MTEQPIEQLLIEAAEQADRKLSAARIAQLKKTFAFFRDAGLSDEAAKKAMGLTAHEMRLMRDTDSQP